MTRGVLVWVAGHLSSVFFPFFLLGSASLHKFQGKTDGNARGLGSTNVIFCSNPNALSNVSTGDLLRVRHSRRVITKVHSRSPPPKGLVRRESRQQRGEARRELCPLIRRRYQCGPFPRERRSWSWTKAAGREQRGAERPPRRSRRLYRRRRRRCRCRRRRYRGTGGAGWRRAASTRRFPRGVAATTNHLCRRRRRRQRAPSVAALPSSAVPPEAVLCARRRRVAVDRSIGRRRDVDWSPDAIDSETCFARGAGASRVTRRVTRRVVIASGYRVVIRLRIVKAPVLSIDTSAHVRELFFLNILFSRCTNEEWCGKKVSSVRIEMGGRRPLESPFLKSKSRGKAWREAARDALPVIPRSISCVDRSLLARSSNKAIAWRFCATRPCDTLRVGAGEGRGWENKTTKKSFSREMKVVVERLSVRNLSRA